MVLLQTGQGSPSRLGPLGGILCGLSEDTDLKSNNPTPWLGKKEALLKCCASCKRIMSCLLLQVEVGPDWHQAPQTPLQNPQSHGTEPRPRLYLYIYIYMDICTYIHFFLIFIFLYTQYGGCLISGSLVGVLSIKGMLLLRGSII